MEPQVIVITGASAGVGRAVARRFAREGASVALLARGLAGLEGARHDVEVLGGTALLARCDVSVARQVEAAAERVERELGPIDVWVNAATVSVFGEVLDLDDEELRRVTDVAYLGTVHGTRAALRRMMPRDRGTIVQVSSAAREAALESAICGARHAVHGFTGSVRRELRGRNSRVWLTIVELPAVNTPHLGWARSKAAASLEPVPPIFAPEVAAEAVRFAAARRRKRVVIGAARVRPTDRLATPERRDNLFAPLDERQDHGARGRQIFNSRTQSVALHAAIYRNLLFLCAATLVAAGIALTRVVRPRRT